MQQNIAQAVEPIFQGLSGTFPVLLTGIAETLQANAFWEAATNTGPVTVVFPSIVGTSNATTATMTGLPPALWPAVSFVQQVLIEDNGTDAFGFVVMGIDGTMLLRPNATASAWTNTGVKGTSSFSVTYMRGGAP